MKIKTKIMGWFLFNLVFLVCLHIHAQTLTGDVQLQYNFANGGTLIYDIPQQGDATVSLSANGKQVVLVQGDLSGVTVNRQSDIAKSKDLLVINDKTFSKLVASGQNISLIQVGPRTLLIDQEGGVYPLPVSDTAMSWSGQWSFSTYLNKDQEPFHILMNAVNGGITTIVIRPKTNTFYAFRFSDDQNNPFDITKFNVGFTLKGALVFTNEKGKPLSDPSGKPLPSIKIATMKTLPSLKDFVGAPQQNNTQDTVANKLYENLNRIKQWLERTVVGQPEVIQGLYNLEVKNAVYGYHREKPEVIYLMGLPGTGKDTAVESYVDAIYGQEGAHREHMFRLPILKKDGDVWSLEGSSTGYLGSENITPFIKWLVAHSGGRYKLASDGKSVTENPSWKPGTVLDGYEPPEKAVVFANEFHDWGKAQKDSFLKQAIEKGYFQINNPGTGISKLYVPVTFILASNEGINLLAPRKGNGERSGKALTYEQLIANWEATHNNDQLLRREIMRTNGQASGGPAMEAAPGISEEMLDRIPASNIFLLRPLAPADLQKVVQLKLEDLQKRFSNTLELKWNPELVNVLQAYQYDAEKNARPMEARVNKMIEDTLLRAVTDGKIPVGAVKKSIELSIVKNPDNTMSLAVKGDYDLTLPIIATEGDRAVPLKTDAEIDQMVTLGSRLKNHVFGADRVAEEVSQDILVSDEGRQSQRDTEKATEPARTYMFLGPSSTGKTEMAKAIAREYLGSESNMTTFDFSQVRRVDDLKARILGSRDSLGNSVASDFMREYDAHQGRIVVVLDEIVNAKDEFTGSSKDLLKALYDILREPVVRTFSDGVPRSMSNVTIIMTGNAGEEWYKDIPRDIPVAEQEAAMEDVYQMAMSDPEFRRRTLENYFSEAFINRVGERNIYFFSPLGFKAIRQLAQLKLMQALKRLGNTEGRRNWKVVFASKEDYIKTLETIENDGFVLREQGASIDRFVKQDIEGNLRYFLLSNKVPDGATVILRRADEKTDGKNVAFEVKIQSPGYNQAQPLYFNVAQRESVSFPKVNPEDQTITAFHEAGHELVRYILMGDKFKSKLISIQPGVTQIQDHWIRYLGIAKQEQEKQYQMTREAVIRDMASMAAGEVAQTLVTQGSIHDAGMSNDMERATALAQMAIAKWGLAPEWGTESIPPNMTIQEYLNTLSPDKKKLFEQLVNKMISEARLMAESVLLTNMENGLIPMALELAQKGMLDAKALEDFYKAHEAQLDKAGYRSVMESNDKMKELEAKWIVPATATSMDGHLSANIPRPASVANIGEIIAAKKAAEIAQVALPENLPVIALPPQPPSPEEESLSVAAGSPEDKTDVKLAEPKLAVGASCPTLLNF